MISEPNVRRCYNCQHYSDNECYKIFEAVDVRCDCEGPIDGMRVDSGFCCIFHVFAKESEGTQ